MENEEKSQDLTPEVGEGEEFDLNDILNEFHDLPQEDEVEPDEELSQLLQMPDPDITPVVVKEPELALPEEESAGQDDTVVFETPAEEAEKDPTDDDTVVLERPPETAPAFEVEEEFIPAPIVFTPHSRLKELRKKLVAGPEKRYYELTSQGIGRLQIAILVSIVLVALCAGVTTLFALDMVPENRLRLVIFSQVLAMLVSALMGCNLMLDSLADLWHGRFSVNTLLTVTFIACCVDAVLCLQELRVPCCAAFSLEMAMALWGRYQKRTAEIAQMDTMRKAVRLHGITRTEKFWNGADGLLQTEGEVEDFMENYDKTSGPELIQGIYAFVCLLACAAIAVFTGLLHGASLGIQVLATSLLVAVPASFFVAITRPFGILEHRLHMVGSVICGWQGVKGLCGRLAYPLQDEDLFPQGSTKLNGVKFYGSRSPEETIAFSTALICAAGGGLVPVFKQLRESRGGLEHTVENFQNYGGGGIGGEVCGEPVLMGSLNFMQDMGVEIPEGTMVSQAVYAAIDGKLSAVYAISYAKMRSAAAGLVTLTGYRKLTPVMLCGDFMLTEEFIHGKFGVKPRRLVFPDREEREALSKRQPNPEEPVLAMSTREELVGKAYAVTGARSLATSVRLGMGIHLFGGILGMLIMLVLGYLGATELLTPTNVLLYQLIWAVPGLLVTEWMRTV
ncbi:MAG: hypothetical protein Q4F17_09765 [Eubacteriales bacterium]|nr:hypothetical protein [Eubacteriales bacterium]